MQQKKFSDLDTAWHSAFGRLTGGLSPAALMIASFDWGLHVLGSPAKQLELFRQAATPEPQPPDDESVVDNRFQDPAWSDFPYNVFRNTFLAQQAWWDSATREVKGVDPRHLRIVNFAARQMLDMVSPSNFMVTNPVVLSRTRKTMGANLLQGARNLLIDFNRLVSGSRERHPDYVVGETLAVTSGVVVFRNELMELIRYASRTPKQYPEPILIVPAWIMKFYILDLSPQNSVVKYLLDQGFDVYVISWKNPESEDAQFGMQDYVDLGVRAAMAHVQAAGAERLHGVGYCLGGTLLAIVASALACEGDRKLATVSLLASQVDFSEPGELGLFINESQVSFLEDLMNAQGFLRAEQMAGAFQILRSNDLIWSRVIRHYLLGERTAMNDLMAWNADSTRLPARMHSEYLRRLFLDNELSRGQYEVDGKPVALSDIRQPIFCLATESDHVSPWDSVYKLLLLTDTDVDFVLTNGGHNGGVLSEPGHPGRHFRTRFKSEKDCHLAASEWFREAPLTEGSWWPVWTAWLEKYSGTPVAPRKSPEISLGPAPGRYVFG